MVLDTSKTLEEIGLPGQLKLVATEMLTQKAKQLIHQFYMEDPLFFEQNKDSALFQTIPQA